MTDHKRLERLRIEAVASVKRLQNEIELHEKLANEHPEYSDDLAADMLTLRSDMDRLSWILSETRRRLVLR